MPQTAELIGLGMPAELAAEVTDGTITGNLSFTASGNHVKYKAGTTAGTFTANGATSVVVNTTAASDTMVVAMSLRTVGGTPAGAPYIFAKTNGTSFTVRAVAGDTSVYNWVIIETNAP